MTHLSHAQGECMVVRLLACSPVTDIEEMAQRYQKVWALLVSCEIAASSWSWAQPHCWKSLEIQPISNRAQETLDFSQETMLHWGCPATVPASDGDCRWHSSEKDGNPLGPAKHAHTQRLSVAVFQKKHLLGKANEYVNAECMQCNSFCWSISSASTSSFQFRNGEVAKGPYGLEVSYSSLYNSKALRSAANGRPLRYGRGHLPELQLDATGGFSTPVTHLCCH